MFWNKDTNTCKRGIVVYCKDELTVNLDEDLTNNCKIESLWLRTSLSDNSDLLLGCIYRSPDRSITNHSLVIDAINSAVQTKTKHLIITGDFNYPRINWSDGTGSTNSDDSNWPEDSFTETLADNFLYQLIDEPTRHRPGETSHTLDLILTNAPHLVDPPILDPPLGKSDHLTIRFSINISPNANSHRAKIPLYSKGDYDKLRHDLNSVNWTATLEGSIDEAWTKISSAIKQIVAKHVPVASPSSHTKRPKWMTAELLRLINKRNKAWHHYRLDRTQRNYQEYKTLRNTTTTKVRGAKRSHERQLVEQVKSSPKAFWKVINKKLSSNINIPDLNNSDGTKAQTSTEKAEALSAQYAKVFTLEPPVDDAAPTPCGPTHLANIVIQEKEVNTALTRLNPNKGSGPDGIHPRILRDAKDELAPVLTKFFNKSL